jgi:YHS domain-containing protein
MLLRLILFIVLALFVARAFWRLMDGVIEGLRGPSGSGKRTPARGVHMVRDPVCGTFVLPDRAVSIADGHQRIYFCSAACRDKYRARTA